MVRKIFCSKIAFVLGLIFLWSIASPSLAATLSLSPANSTYSLGTSFTAVVMVTSLNEVANAVSGSITFPTDKLEVLSLGKNNSVITYWVREPSYSNVSGRIEFEGVAPNPGFSGVNRQVLTITFRPKIAGMINVDFNEGSILANDGQGTNLLNLLGDANYLITLAKPKPPIPEITEAPEAPLITSPSHPNPTTWYNNSSVIFNWELPSDINAVNILANHSPSTNPGTISDGLFSTYNYKEVKDGVWYFHLRLRNKNGWGDTSHFGFNIDTVSPTNLQLVLAEQTDQTAPEVEFLITADDVGSGVDHYEISVDGASPSVWTDSTGDHRFRTPRLKPGPHTLLVKVYDKAGNSLASSLDFSISPIRSPKIVDYPREIEKGETVTLRGEALAGELVIFSFKRPDGGEMKQETRADQSGFFVISVNEKWVEGVYSATAITRDSRGAESDPSETVVIAVYLPVFWQWGNDILRWLSIIVPILGLLILLIFVILWSYFRMKKLKQAVRRESREATEALHKAFDFLRERSRDQLALLDSIKERRALTKEESSLAENLRQNLNNVEDYVRKEIGDVEDVVNK